MFSQTAEYALRAVTALARNADAPMTTARIAAEAHIPPGYLSKVLQTLARQRIIGAVRGPNGGYRLRRAARDITIYDVIEAVDPIGRIRSCPLDLPEHAHQLCPLHKRLDDALEQLENVLRGTKIDDLNPPAKK